MEFLNPSDSLERQNEKLLRITEALMRKVEQSPDQSGLAYAQFERAALLEEQVRQRTQDLERTLDLLHESNARFAMARQEAEAARANLADAIETIDEGFALFDQDDRLVLYNSRFCQNLPDVRARLETALAFDLYVDLISESSALDWRGKDTPENWRKQRRELHRKEHVVFNIRLTENRWLQVSEHRTETRGTVILQTDVTEIMRLERRERDKLVHRQALMLRATLDHLNQGVCIFDNERRLVGLNQRMEQMLRRPVEKSLRGTQFDALLDRIDLQFSYSTAVGKRELQDWAQQKTGRDPLSLEVRRQDNAIFDVFAQEMPDRGFVISLSDVTLERRAAESLREMNETLERRVADRTVELGQALEDARRANASKTRFVAAASHDLLQPISAAKLYASALEERLDTDTARQLAEKTTSALESAEAIISALLDISKLDLGMASFKIAPVDLGRLFAGLENEFAPIAAARGLELHLADTSAQVLSDATYLHRIIQNLISNAVRYTTGTKILVGARHRGKAVRIEVWDQGPGISQDHQSLIFQEFKQLKQAQSGEGLGLGLAIVERACKMLSHDLQLRSDLGQGSCFSVEIERVAAQSAPQTPRPAPPRPVRVDGLLVGLVENDADLANGICLTIESLGCDVIHAADATEALTLLDEVGVVPDCFLIDYQLGEGPSGTELIPMLRARYGDLPMDIISADRSQSLREQCRTLGVSLRHKPLTRADIEDMLMTAAARNADTAAE